MIFTTYDAYEDITTIFEEIRNGENMTIEVKGFYFGEPDEESTKKFCGSLKAEH